jgi:hypothetical protein
MQDAPATPITVENVEQAFGYQPTTPPRALEVRGALVTAAKKILTELPSGPQQTGAIGHLTECWHGCAETITPGGRV